MGLIDDLKPGPVALDTQIFIYFIEEDGRFLPLVKPLFEAIDRGDLVGVTSGLSLKSWWYRIGLAILRLLSGMRLC